MATAVSHISLLARQYTLKEYQSRLRAWLHMLVVSVTNSYPAALSILLYSSKSKKWSSHGLTSPSGSCTYGNCSINRCTLEKGSHCNNQEAPKNCYFSFLSRTSSSNKSQCRGTMQARETNSNWLAGKHMTDKYCISVEKTIANTNI